MRRMRFEKYNIRGGCEKRITLPMFLMRIVVWMMPRNTVRALASKGLDLPAVMEASRHGVLYRCEFPIREHGEEKRLVVSLV